MAAYLCNLSALFYVYMQESNVGGDLTSAKRQTLSVVGDRRLINRESGNQFIETLQRVA